MTLPASFKNIKLVKRCFIYLAVTVLLLVGMPSLAQNLSRINQLKRDLSDAKDHVRYNILNDLGFEYRLSYPDSTIYYCNQAYRLGKELNITSELAKAVNFIGLAYAYKGDYKRSFEYHNRAVAIAESQQDSLQLAYSYNNLGRLLFDQGDMVRAYNTFIKARQLFEVLNDTSGLSYVSRSLASLHKSQHDFDNALRMSLEAVKLREEISEPRGVLSALMELGLVYEAMNDTANAIRALERADSIAVQIDDKISQAEINLALGELFLDQSQMRDAQRVLLSADRIIEEADNQRLRPQLSCFWGRYYYEMNNDSKAIDYLNSIIEEAEKTGNLSQQREGHLYLSRIYERTQNHAKSIEHSHQYLILNESLQNVDLARQIGRLQFQLEIEKKERENEMLKANKATNEALIEKQRLQNVMLIIITLLVSVLVVVQFYYSKKAKQINGRLANKNAEIQKQREEIVQQNEKLSIRNQELCDLNNEKDTLMSIVAHDLKSPLHRIKGMSEIFELEGGLTSNQQTYIEIIKDATYAGLDLITDLLDVHKLEENSVPQYSRIDISDFLYTEAELYQQTADAKNIHFHISRIESELFDTDTNYFSRILGNLITNAIKFSPPGSELNVSAGVRGNEVWFSVKDQGPGFTEEDRVLLFQKFRKLSARPTAGESSNGLGLAIVKTLVDRLQGSIVLHSSGGKGSEFIITMPQFKPKSVAIA